MWLAVTILANATEIWECHGQQKSIAWSGSYQTGFGLELLWATPSPTQKSGNRFKGTNTPEVCKTFW